jgi:Fur family transcriptional regulator, ferric uptake regulator
MNFPKHLKKTKSRLQVFELFAHEENAMSVDVLSEKLPTVHLATLYRIVEEFEKEGVLRLTDDFNPKKKRYQFNEAKHYHYLKCVECKKEIRLETCPVHFHAPKGFVVLSHRLEIEGLCESCAQKRAS